MVLLSRSLAGRLSAWPLVNAVQLALAATWTAGWISLALVARLISGGTRLPLVMARRWWAPGMLAIGGLRLEVEGLDHLAEVKTCFLAANHRSVADIPVLFRALPLGLRFLAKAELRRVPFLGWYMRAMGMVFIDRRDRRGALASLHRAARQVGDGVAVMTFPEGTRGTDGVGVFRAGAFQAALEAGVPVVPVAIEGTGRALPPGGFRLRPGRVRVAVGAPIATEGRVPGERRRLAEETRRVVIELLRPHP